MLEAATSSSGEVVTTVTDNGIGIAPEMQAMIFEMFAQVDHALERTVAGLGVGLSLARHLLELHHGSVTVHSDGIGHGSTFTVRLPTQTAGIAPAPGVVDDKARDLPPTYDILLAEDNCSATGYA